MRVDEAARMGEKKQQAGKRGKRTRFENVLVIMRIHILQASLTLANVT